MPVTIETPEKGEKYDLPALSSPLIDDCSSVIDSVSSIDYINAQLVAHGFISPPGIILDGISKPHLDGIVKCLLGMLSQRVEDMTRTEELTAKLRTLTYDHERLMSLHRDSKERAANAEREMNVHKSRLGISAATRTLQANEAAHKQTSAELQRTRVAMQGVRATYHTELKKKEKEVERMAEKWNKLADSQAKLMMVPSGLQCANLAVSTGAERLGTSSFLESTLDETERARSQLAVDNIFVRNLVVTAVNEVQSALHHVRPTTAENHEAKPQPTPFTLTTLFPMHLAGNADDKLHSVIKNLKATLTTLSEKQNLPVPSPQLTVSSPAASDVENQRLQNLINTLQDELEQSRQQLATQASETRAMFDKFTKDHRTMTGEIAEMSVELMSAPLRDAERDRLDEIKKQLDQERQKFTEAAIELGKERKGLQAERIKLQDEKRAWQLEMMLADLPPTPQNGESPKKMVAARESLKKSQKKSPAKVRVGKAGSSSRKTTRISRRSSLVSPSKVLPPYETEVPPPLPALSFNPKPLGASLLPTSFVLPPPSPHASLPMEPAILPLAPSIELTEESPEQSTTPLSPPSPPEPEHVGLTVPTTPSARRPFPVAKPFAQHMVHAYSPAKPSPLSRILLLGNSPNSPDAISVGSGDLSSLLEPVMEHPEQSEDASDVAPVQMSLAAELGVPESDSESPLQGKNVVKGKGGRPPNASTTRTNTSRDKGKAKALPPTTGRAKTSAVVEKENSRNKYQSKVAPKLQPPSAAEDKKPVKPSNKASTVSSSRSGPIAKPPPIRGGPRRVLIDSEEAPVVGKGWRG
ncbi:hypothetical protein H0H92_005839 [Tricholoma furcatifolium]|nr:hypothetical protein H0H92_005839 [Tricholoma furcatifolium]